jgi:hypothetical protein
MREFWDGLGKSIVGEAKKFLESVSGYPIAVRHAALTFLFSGKRPL